MSTLQVDRIIPYQSSSVTIEGDIVQPNAATTGSNTFVGNQNIQGTITASIAQGFALVGGVGNISTLVATSSFGGALPSGVVSGSSQLTASYDTRYALSGSGGGGSGFPFVGDAQITGSLTISSSAAVDLDVIGGVRITGSLLLTGSSIFTGDQTLVDGAGNTITLSDASGSLMLVAKTFTSASAHLTASAGNQVNIIFKNNDNTTNTIISGSNNIFTNQSAPTADFRRVIGSNNIVNSAAGMPQVTGSMTTPITMASNYFGNSTTTLRGPITGSGYTISNNAVFGTLNIGQAALNDVTRASGFIFTGNQVIGTMGFVATTSAILPTLVTSPQATNNIVNGSVTATMNSSSVNLTTNIINAGAFQITNNYFNGGAGTGSITIGQNIVGGAQFTTLIAQGSNPVGTTNNPNVQGNLIYGLSNATHINGDNSRIVGTNAYTNLIATSVLGSNLAVTGSSLVGDTTTVGSAFVGRFNANDGIRNKTSDIVFAVGTGTATGTRKTGFLIDSGSNTFVEGTLNVSGSSVFTGSLILSSSATTELQVIGNTEFTGSVSIQSGSAFFANGNRQFNLGAFQSNVSQSGSANVSQSMNFEITDISQGVSIASNSRITLANSGTYNIQFSAQTIAGGGADELYIWLKKNGTNVSGTAGHIQLANNAELIASWNYVVDATASDYYELAWQATNASTILLTEAATGNIPSVPSVILTVTQVR